MPLDYGKTDASRYAKKALKVLIKDDVDSHYNWISQATDLMKQYELTDYHIPSAKIKTYVIENFRKNLFDRIKHCGPGKKLRTRKLFKNSIRFESYLDIFKSPPQRKIYSKFRLSSHELEIEQGRYGAKCIPADQRYCKLCKTGKVEDEFHFVIECPIYEKETIYLNVLINILFECIDKHFI